MDFHGLHTNAKNLLGVFDKIINETVKENENELVDLNTGQLEMGMAIDGLPIEPQYAYDDYAQYKISIGAKPPKGVPDLKLSGDFYSGFNISKITPRYIEIDSKDAKTKWLESHYQDQVFGLTGHNKGEYAEMLKEPLKDKIYDQLTK